jgi:hypothetical protein
MILRGCSGAEIWRSAVEGSYGMQKEQTGHGHEQKKHIPVPRPTAVGVRASRISPRQQVAMARCQRTPQSGSKEARRRCRETWPVMSVSLAPNLKCSTITSCRTSHLPLFRNTPSSPSCESPDSHLCLLRCQTNTSPRVISPHLPQRHRTSLLTLLNS